MLGRSINIVYLHLALTSSKPLLHSNATKGFIGETFATTNSARGITVLYASSDFRCKSIAFDQSCFSSKRTSNGTTQTAKFGIVNSSHISVFCVSSPLLLMDSVYLRFLGDGYQGIAQIFIILKYTYLGCLGQCIHFT